MEQVFYRLGNTNNNFQYPCERFEFTKRFIWAALGKSMIGLGFFVCVWRVFLFVCLFYEEDGSKSLNPRAKLFGGAGGSITVGFAEGG